MIDLLLFLAIAIQTESEGASPDQLPSDKAVTAGAEIPAETSASAKSGKDAPDYVRCVRMRITGSNIKRKVCQTNAQWDQMAAKGNSAATEIFDESNKGHTNGN